MRRSGTSARAGFTALELVIAISLLALVIANIVMVMESSSTAYRVASSSNDVEFQANRTLDRIALAIMGASRSSLSLTAPAPIHDSRVEYEHSLGYQNGQPVFADPEQIEFDVTSGQVVWTQNPDEPQERTVVWTNWVRDFLQDEALNGGDDNGNGLADEKGLSFDLEGDRVNIRLTLEKEGPDGTTITKTVSTRVTCRN